MENHLIDNLDRGILEALMSNARTAYAELTRQFGVSPGTIHIRVEKMKQTGVTTGARIDISLKQLGYDVGCFIGIILKGAKDYPSAPAKLESLDEVTEAYYTTGRHNIFVRVMCRPINTLQHVLINKIQTIDEIQSTETLIVPQNPVIRTIKPWSIFLIPYFPTGKSQRVRNVQYTTLNKDDGLWQVSLLSAVASSTMPNM